MNSGSEDGKVYYWDMLTGKVVHTRQAHKYVITLDHDKIFPNLCFLPSLSYCVVKYFCDTSVTVASDLIDNLSAINFCRGIVTSVSCHPSQPKMVSSSLDSSIIVWNTDWRNFHLYTKARDSSTAMSASKYISCIIAHERHLFDLIDLAIWVWELSSSFWTTLQWILVSMMIATGRRVALAGLLEFDCRMSLLIRLLRLRSSICCGIKKKVSSLKYHWEKQIVLEILPTANFGFCSFSVLQMGPICSVGKTWCKYLLKSLQIFVLCQI